MLCRDSIKKKVISYKPIKTFQDNSPHTDEISGNDVMISLTLKISFPVLTLKFTLAKLVTFALTLRLERLFSPLPGGQS